MGGRDGWGPKVKDFQFQVRNQDVRARAGNRGKYTDPKKGL